MKHLIAVTMAALALATLPALSAQAQEQPTFNTKVVSPQAVELLTMLKEGGYVIYFRHGSTPDYREPKVEDFADCPKQRNLNSIGRYQAFLIGEGFRNLGIPVGEVFSSPYCRCVDTARLAFGKYVILDELRDGNYVLLWIAADGSVRINATYSKTMTQYLNDTAGGLKAELKTNSASKIEGRVYSPAPLKTMGGATYTVDVTFSADVIPAQTGTALPAGGGDPGKALLTFLAAITKKDWTGIKAGLSPKTLPRYDHSYDTPAENLASAVDILSARLTVAKAKVTGGLLVSPAVAVIEMEGERFGTTWLSLVRMVKTGTVWQFEDSAPVGMIR